MGVTEGMYQVWCDITRAHKQKEKTQNDMNETKLFKFNHLDYD